MSLSRAAGSPPAEWRITLGGGRGAAGPWEGAAPRPVRTHASDEVSGCTGRTPPSGRRNVALMILEHLAEEGLISLQIKRPEESVRGSLSSGEGAQGEAPCGATACRAALP